MKKHLVTIVLFLLLLVLFTGTTHARDKKYLIIAVDGMDYSLLSELLERGEMPNFDRLRKTGDFKPLQTSMPPQSPVAWSNFITGMDPGGHAIFDFIHRTPEDLMPYLSTSRASSPSKVLSIGKYRIPLKSEGIKLLRKGRAFWDILEEHGIPTTIISIPSNFPPIKNTGRSLSGMGTPDVLGSYGTYTFVTSDPEEKEKAVTGGVIHYTEIKDNQVSSFIPGPTNALVKDNPPTQADMTVYIDPENDVAKIVVQEQEILLARGEWSEFVKIQFDMVPFVKASGIVRFYLKQVHPYFKLYISPVNIDPSDPAMPITNPEEYAMELYENIGYFYTQGMAEDTKALDSGILSESEFLEQTQIILKERLKMLDYELSRFKKGLLFFYFSNIDLSSHMFWRFISKDHPDYNNEEFKRYRNSLYDSYRQIDDILGDIQEYVDDNTILMVMSDHGFKNFGRKVNINRWLAKEGFAKLSPDWKEDDKNFESVNWYSTSAYALGINGIYINLKGRERNGIIEPGEQYEKTVNEIADKLEAMTDPKTGKHVVRKAFKKYETYHGQYTDDAPDIIVGFYQNYRSSDESALGQFSREVITDNKKKWSGDHCMDYREVPGIILINRKIEMKEPALYDIAPTILKEYGIAPLGEMIGEPIY